MKKTTKVNPLEFFRKSAEARHKAITSGGVTEPKQKLKKAQEGIAVNDKAAKIAAAFSSPQNNPVNTPYNNVVDANQKIKDILPSNNVPRPVPFADYNSKRDDLNKAYLDSVTNNWDAKRTPPENSGAMQARSNAYQKTGGTHKMPNGKVMLNSKMKMGGGVKKKFDDGGPTDPNKYVMNKTNAFGNTKFKEISKNKFDRVSNRYAKQEGSESFGDNKSINQQVISGKNKKNYVSRADEVRRAESSKKLVPRVSQTKNVPPIKTRVPLMKIGGTTKAAKFAALAPPYNKATLADRIVGAKKNKKK